MTFSLIVAHGLLIWAANTPVHVLISYLVYTLLMAPQPQALGIVDTHEYYQWRLPQWRGVDVGTDIYYYWFVSSAIICHLNTFPATPTGRMSLESGVQRQKLV